MKFVNSFHNTEIDIEPTSVGTTTHSEPFAEFTESQIKTASMALCGIQDCTCHKLETYCYDNEGKSYLILVKV